MVCGQRPLDLELEPNSKFSEKGLPYICCASCCIHGLSSLIGTYSKGGVKYEGCRIPVGFREGGILGGEFYIWFKKS
jgi:hypothetical protein